MDSRKRYDSGFTLVEIIAVLLLMSIIAATVLGRSINTENIDLASQTAKISNHIRYAEAMAMKRSDTVWGIKCQAGPPNEYWLFSGTDPDDAAKQVMIPGENTVKISLSTHGVVMGAFTIFFDKYSKPYNSYTDETTNDPRTTPKNITVVAGSKSRIISITAETGFIK